MIFNERRQIVQGYLKFEVRLLTPRTQDVVPDRRSQPNLSVCSRDRWSRVEFGNKLSLDQVSKLAMQHDHRIECVAFVSTV